MKTQLSQITILGLFLINSLTGFSQIETSSKLYKDLQVNDSLIFDSSFNTCNLKLLATLINDDFEFYHDKAGLLEGKDSFIENTKNGLCKSENELRRELISGTLEVFPMMKNDGTIYAAIQKASIVFRKRKTNQYSLIYTSMGIQR